MSDDSKRKNKCVGLEYSEVFVEDIWEPKQSEVTQYHLRRSPRIISVPEPCHESVKVSKDVDLLQRKPWS